MVGGVYELREIDALVATARTNSPADAIPALAALQHAIAHNVAGAHVLRIWIAGGLGLGLTAAATWLLARRMARIDRAMTILVSSADRIGHGAYWEPVPETGAEEVAPLAASLEQMRLTLTGTTISRNHLDALLNSMSDAVLVTAPDGRVRTENLAAARLLGYEPGQLIGVELGTLVANEHRAGFSVEKILANPAKRSSRRRADRRSRSRSPRRRSRARTRASRARSS